MKKVYVIQNNVVSLLFKHQDMIHTKPKKYVYKNWDELTKPQQEELLKQMGFHKIPENMQKKLRYQIFEDQTVRGYVF